MLFAILIPKMFLSELRYIKTIYEFFRIILNTLRRKGRDGMFCKWCGKNISGKAVTICPFCGKEQSPLMSGNGFWDLCSIEPETGSIKFPSVSDAVGSKDETETRSHFENSEDEIVQSNRIAKGGLAKLINKHRYGELCLIIILLLNLITGTLNVICWPILFVKQMEQHRADENAYIRDEFSDLSSALNDITEVLAKNKETFVLQSSESVFEADEIGNISEETDKAIVNDPDSQTVKLVRYIVDEEQGLCLLVAEDIPNQNDICSYYWQMSEDGGETWLPLINGSRYIVLSQKENEQYRLILSGKKVYLAYFP